MRGILTDGRKFSFTIPMSPPGRARLWTGHRNNNPHRTSHSGLLEPLGTSTVLKEPGVRDITIWSVIP